MPAARRVHIASCLTADGNWLELRESAVAQQPAPALLLDRDGVVVEERNYLSGPEDVVLISSAADTIRHVNERGWHVVLITNQAGIGRGYFGWTEFSALQERKLASAGDPPALPGWQ